jgi:hypothetical protein
LTTLWRLHHQKCLLTSQTELNLLNAGEFAVYEKQPGDQIDFSDFNNIVDPQEIKWTTNILRRLISKDRDTYVLTARANTAADAIKDYLGTIGLPQVQVITLGSSDPRDKSAYIAQSIDDIGYDYVEFFDDSKKNVDAVAELRELYPNVTFVLIICKKSVVLVQQNQK